MVEVLLSEDREHIYDNLLAIRGKILRYIREHSNEHSPIYSKDIQEAFNLHKTTVSQYLRYLEEIGLIYRKRVGRYKILFPK